jgi:hypothetical protein
LKDKEGKPYPLYLQRHLFVCSIILLGLLAISSANFVIADKLNPHIYSTSSAPYGIPYQQWTAKFWQWLYSLPASQHPRENYTPDKCANGQHGPVWFLDAPLSGKQDRTCTIPAGKSILAAVLNGECDVGDPNTRHGDQDLRKCASEGNDYAVVSGTLDGVKIKNLDRYRTDSGFYNITHRADNFYGLPGGVYRAITNGFFVFLEPLSPGKHDLQLSVSVSNPINSGFDYAAVWTYHLIIK